MEPIETYDVLIIGTSLKNAVLAAALSIAGRKVIHVDSNTFYGEINACLSPPFTCDGLDHVMKSFSVSEGAQIARLGAPGSYNVEVSPKLLYANSRMVQVLRDLGIGDYVQFKSLTAIYLANETGLVPVPTSKEAIFTSDTLTLIMKRRLMKFIKFCSDYVLEPLYIAHKDMSLSELMENHFRLDTDLINALVYALGQPRTTQTTVEETVPIIHAHIHSLGVFGAFPILIPMYGSGSELTQAFCRKAAVNGCTYVLGDRIDVTTRTTDVETVTLASGHKFHAQHVIHPSSNSGLESARRFLIVEGEFTDLMCGSDGISIVYQPAPGDNFVLHCQIHGSALGVCPAGQSIIYFHAEAGASWAQFDAAQSMLLRHLSCKVIVQVQYRLLNDTKWTSYDDLIGDAERLFSGLVGCDVPFLPREEVSEHNGT